MEKNCRVTKGRTDVPTQTYRGRTYYLYPGEKYYSGAGKRLHVKMWEDANGPVPKGFSIHHKDEDKEHNVLENFELINSREHISRHAKQRAIDDPEGLKRFQAAGIEAAKDWHASPEGLDWHRAHAQKHGFGQQTYGERPCEVCGKTFVAGNIGQRFCGNNCKSQFRRLSGIDDIDKTCACCGETFRAGKYVRTKVCSIRCSRKLGADKTLD